MKKQLTSALLSGLGLLFFFSSCTKKEGQDPVPASLETGLLAHYSFDGNANDLSGKGHHATISGAVLTADRTGKNNTAYLFDGWDDMIVVNAAAGLNTSNLTYAAWVKPMANPATNSYSCLVSIGGQGADQCITINNNYHSTLGINVGGYNNTGTASATSIDSKQLPTLNEWIHVAYSRSNTDIKMYINGVEKASISTNNALPKYTTPLVFTIGTRYNMSEAFFTGALDDLRIYDRALSAAEVQELYKQ